MRKLVVTQFVSLDGVMEDPGGSEGTPLAAWSFKFDRGDDGNKFKLDEMMASDALLLGRKTYEGFAEAWPSRKDDAGFADKFNGMPKYVVSTHAEGPGVEQLARHRPGDIPVDEVNRLKQEGDGDILVNGSNTLDAGADGARPGRRVPPDGLPGRPRPGQEAVPGRPSEDHAEARELASPWARTALSS